MRKILTITLHGLTNPGSALQAYALQKFLLNNNYDTCIIDYNPYYIFTGKKKIKTITGKVLNWKEYSKREKKFKVFRDKYMYLTEKSYRTYNKLKKNPPGADVYITGSDQLWNCHYDCGRDDAFYLSFVKDHVKMSYAASIGKSIISTNEIRFITDRIQDFSFVSVREVSSVKYLENAGIKNIKCVCDPTLLLDINEYKKIMMMPEGISGDYILLYLVKASPLLNNLITEIQKKDNLQVVMIGTFINHYKSDFWLKDAGPQEFIALIANAKLVISGSFHATVFSLIFNKQFYVIPPRENVVRMEHLLQVAGIENRILYDGFKLTFKDIDYESTNKNLTEFIEYSKQTFLENLN